jgi:hypothetical protein
MSILLAFMAGMDGVYGGPQTCGSGEILGYKHASWHTFMIHIFEGRGWICTVRIRLGFVPETEDFECERFLIDSLMAGMEAV